MLLKRRSAEPARLPDPPTFPPPDEVASGKWKTVDVVVVAALPGDLSGSIWNKDKIKIQ